MGCATSGPAVAAPSPAPLVKPRLVPGPVGPDLPSGWWDVPLLGCASPDRALFYDVAPCRVDGGLVDVAVGAFLNPVDARCCRIILFAQAPSAPRALLNRFVVGSLKRSWVRPDAPVTQGQTLQPRQDCDHT